MIRRGYQAVCVCTQHFNGEQGCGGTARLPSHSIRRAEQRKARRGASARLLHRVGTSLGGGGHERF
eukprot:1258176-Pleurochrysis_carterae.AAC.1